MTGASAWAARLSCVDLNWFHQLSPRMRRVLGTTAASYFARLCSAATLLVTLPLARQALDPERFGLWMMIGSLVAFFGFADLGVGNGALNRINRAQADDDLAAVKRVVTATFICTTGLAALLILMWSGHLVASADPLAFAGRVSPEHREEATFAFTVFVALMALNLPLGAIQKLQLGLQDGYWVGAIHATSSLATAVALPVFLLSGASLPWLVIASLGSTVAVNLLVGGWWLKRRGLLVAVWPRRSALSQVPALLHDGLFFFALQVCAAFAFQSDAFVIGNVLGQDAYGDYAAVQRTFLAVSSLVGAALVGLWPAFGDALARGDLPWARAVLRRAILTSVTIVGAVSVSLALASPWLAAHWLHMPSPPMSLPWLLAGWVTIEALGNVCSSFLNGAGLIRPQLLAAVAMATAAFLGKWWLVPLMGAPGAVVATLGAYVCISLPVLAWLISRSLRSRSHCTV